MKKILIRAIGLLLILSVGLFLWLRRADIPVDQLKGKYAPPPSQFVDIDGMNAHYRVEGQGPYLLLLHGTGASLHTWEPWVRVLSDSFTVVTVDLPAFGLTGPNAANDYSTGAYNRFINGLTDHLGMTHFHLGGNSLGGYISWNYALDYPHKVDRLILVDAAGFPTEPVALFKLIKNPVLGPLLSKISVRSLVEKNLKEVYFDPSKVTDELVQRYYDMSLRAGNRQALRARVMRQEKSRVDQLGQIQQPTLIMWGQNDKWIPFENAAKFDSILPNSTIVSYPNAGHIPMEELPTQSASDALLFLTQNLNN